jgi:radical SAM superfamily enzyme YgiQ (UPF0313 family)
MKTGFDRFLQKEQGRSPLKEQAPIHVALAYPNRYAVGMASLGFQTVYRMFNEHPSVRCERVFMNDQDASGCIRTFETGEDLNRFDLIGFSVSFELDIPNVIRMLMQAGIPPFAPERNQAHPLVFLGGAIGGLNPSPLLPFVDGLLAGEGEGIIHQIADVLFQNRQGRHVRENRLEALSGIEGIFIPKHNATVKRHLVEQLIPPPAYTPMVTPFSHFADMFVIEIGRGCPKHCLFCAACKMAHPFRFYSMEAVRDAVRSFNPGAKKVGLEGAGLSDYPHLIPLCHALFDMQYTVSFSSIRADRISEEFISILQFGKNRSFTIAPEAGSESMRRFIGKEISDAALMTKVDLLSESGINVLKLYYLIGLPGETDGDVTALIQSVRDISERFLKKSKTRRLRLSMNAFVPKPFTEFQWAAMHPEKELNRKRKRIASALKHEPRVVLVPKSSREETLQGILSLGDQRTGTAFYHSIRNRTGFRQAFMKSGIDLNRLLYRERHVNESMPWDFIHYDIPKERLWKCYQRGIHDTSRIGDGRS